MKKRMIITLVMVCYNSLVLFADIPSGYYSAAEEKSSTALLNALHTCIDGHTTLSYSSLGNYYDDTDLTEQGYIWDMYSTCKFTINDDGGSQSRVCDVWNKEHSVPQSWFGESSPMKSDLFHVYPTDARVNNYRGNAPYGETSNRSYIDGNSKALGYIGTSNFAGYSGKVFEPVDEYKGDFARTYFYMVARYLDKNFNKNETGKVVFTYSSGKTNLTNYAKNLFLKWHREDPVSEKEIDRNNAVYKHQKNRNPFIDYPYLVEYIWGDHVGETLYFDDIISSSDPEFIPGESDGSGDGSGEPLLKVNKTQINFASVIEGGKSNATLQVEGIRLTAGISFTITGTHASSFSISPASITISSANKTNTVSLTYEPSTSGQHSATLQIESAGAETLSVKLYGACNASCNVVWMVDGEEYTIGDPTTIVPAGGKVSVLPTAPQSPCDDSEQFVGWSEVQISTPQDEIPDDLFSDESDAPIISHNVVYNAVFAHLTESGTSTPESLFFAQGETTGWTISGTSYTNKYWKLTKGAYIESPQFDLSKLQSITLNVRTYGGTSYNIIDISCNGQKIGEVDAVNSTLKDVTFTPSSPLSGDGKIRFDSEDNTDSNAPAVAKITIYLEGGPTYSYSQYVTLCNAAATDVELIEETTIHTGKKLLINGQLVVELNGVYYNTLGQIIQ